MGGGTQRNWELEAVGGGGDPISSGDAINDIERAVSFHRCCASVDVKVEKGARVCVRVWVVVARGFVWLPAKVYI